ncbi:TonB-dependent siderophore receptor [Bosea rubneri]|uniref:TonB-dependent siderophore receptor n=1 Tax=Bosea rubneri TaxID=3075434 RepID=A0ABU3SDK0_9HYPH|nr:TonB-dependent siderophore receptor [Bosea sp. ZW T0_25]MDU0342877.1 TonB-dependent siderophore receptor [Bosea sp. ZW T0_25]
MTDPNYDGYEREQFGVGYIFEHRFNDTVKIGSRLRYGGLDSDFRVLQMAGPLTGNGLIPRHAAHAVERAYGLTTDNNVQLDFSTGPVTHTVLAGIDFRRTTSDFKFDLGAAQPLDVTNPRYGFPVGPFATYTDSEQKMQQLGVYLQDQISFGNFHALLGVRHDWADEESRNRLKNTTQTQSERAASYRTGLLYQFDNGIAPYVSYSTSFEPVIGVDASGKSFVPTEASQFEVGVKYKPDFMDALFTVSAFDITQNNVLTPGPVLGFNIQQGEIRSRGLEFEARGNVTPNLELIGALTLLNTEIAASNISPSVVGNRPQGIPDYFGSLWANYKFDAGALNGLTLGGGVRFVGASYADDANKVRAPGYTLIDAAIRYDLGAANAAWKGAEATLNVTNLLDKEYYSGCSTGFYCQVGNGRTVLAGLRYRW